MTIMNTFDAIKERRSVKHYDVNHKLTMMMSLAVLSPISFKAKLEICYNKRFRN